MLMCRLYRILLLLRMYKLSLLVVVLVGISLISLIIGGLIFSRFRLRRSNLSFSWICLILISWRVWPVINLSLLMLPKIILIPSQPCLYLYLFKINLQLHLIIWLCLQMWWKNYSKAMIALLLDIILLLYRHQFLRRKYRIRWIWTETNLHPTAPSKKNNMHPWATSRASTPLNWSVSVKQAHKILARF